ncbi:TetR/AcrR family transcriptional regulator [Inconstantimicrobium mannanitabidum]|uniref:TetR family transcriptional regulator n=1 Tax=Inconstantimicrobium mannanitabidum TaxID=1604901 RepID=A0ACB5RBN9_9CLOT|nr:TetR/AcrR family transcriptional regulator [Clostridium sp. TW13]GKX66469.1 TetR family transcriptional regulator [Clostridium sp. TW13]
MDTNKYHHGDLKQQLIDNGLLLLNQAGVEGFSLRKVASMCGVSHSAPYKHFKDKESLINEIAKEVWKRFYLAIQEIATTYAENPKVQLVEMGKAYVKFMVENPDYLKFMFLSENVFSINIKEKEFFVDDNAFDIFKSSAENYFKSINLDKEQYLEKTLAMWSLVHGITILIIQKSILYDGDYLQLVENIIKNNI